MSGRSIRVGLLAVALTASACTQPQVCKLGIVAPADGMLLGPKDDVSN